MSSHNEAVNEFMKTCQEKDPEQFANVCKKYPVVDNRAWSRIREREIPYSSVEFEELFAADTKLDQED